MTKHSLHAYSRKRKRISDAPEGWCPSSEANVAHWIEEGGWNCSEYVLKGHKYHRRMRLVFNQHPPAKVEWYLIREDEDA